MKAPTQAVVAVVQMRTQPLGVIHQVTIRPDKVKQSEKDIPLIRLGETPGDEYNGWMYLEAIEVVCVLGKAVQTGDKWECVPDALEPGST